MGREKHIAYKFSYKVHPHENIEAPPPRFHTRLMDLPQYKVGLKEMIFFWGGVREAQHLAVLRSYT